MNSSNHAIAAAENENLPPLSSSNEKNNKMLLTVAYGLYLTAVFIFIFAFVAIVLNHTKKRELSGSAYFSHLLWQMRTFWWCFLWLAFGLAVSLVGLYTLHVPVGLPVYICVAIWYLYRNIRGLVRLLDGRSAY